MKQKIKLILWDFNGVTVKGSHKDTAKYFGKKHGTPWKEVYDIVYTKYFNQIVENKITETAGWKHSIKELGWSQDWQAMRQWHLENQQLDLKVIKVIQQLRLEGYKCVLLSKNLTDWFAYYEQRLRFRMHFDYVINSQEIGLPKASKETMRWISKRFDVKPKEILYIDDQDKNLRKPKQMGVHTILYKNYTQGMRDLKKVLGGKWLHAHHYWVEESQRQRMSPFPNIFSTQAITTITAQFAGHHFKIMFLLENRLMWFLTDKEDYFIARQNLLRHVLDDEEFIQDRIIKVRKFGTALVAFARSVASSNLLSANNTKLGMYYKRYQKLYVPMYGNYFPALMLDRVLGQYLKGLLFQKVTSRDALEKYFTILTINTHAMYPKQEEESLLILAKLVTSNVRLQKLFRQDSKKVLIGMSEFSSFKKKFNAHHQHFFWLTRDYEDPVLSKEDFVLRIKKALRYKNVDAKLQGVKSFSVSAKKQILATERSLRLTSVEKAAFELMRECIYLKEFRKKFVSLSLYHMDSLLFEMSRRLGISVAHTRQFLSDEPVIALAGKKDFSTIVRDRYELSAYITNHGRINVITGKKALALKSKVLHLPRSWSILHGVPVSSGKARGTAKIVINLEDLKKVKRGDIIVTVQAVPSFSSAISLSAGMVADGGTGVTSHPATLAREANIPCVTGLRIASQIIKDGDQIEVDGSRGVVKKL